MMNKRDIDHIQKIVDAEADKKPYGRSYNEVATDTELTKWAKRMHWRTPEGQAELAATVAAQQALELKKAAEFEEGVIKDSSKEGTQDDKEVHDQ